MQLAEKVKLSKFEKKIVFARCSGESFCDLSETDQSIVAAEIIAKGAAMTGCQIPSTEFFMNVLRSEIVIFINEFGYESLTEQELYTAMRLNASGGLKFPSGLDVEIVEFNGYTFHVEFLSKVLQNYSKIRYYLDRKFENSINGY